MNTSLLHEKALSLSQTYRQSESELLGILIEMQKRNSFSELDYPNLFSYCVMALKLSEAQACYFSKVAKKSEEVPALKAAIDDGTLSLSQARRVVPVITQENSQLWIEKAASLPQRALEKEVAVVNPKAIVKERIRVVAESPRHSKRLRYGTVPITDLRIPGTTGDGSTLSR